MKQGLVTPENKKWWTLAAVSIGLFMIMLDNTVVNVALPSMRASLHMTLSELEWVVAGYALTFAAFMLTGGKLADFVGRRLVFMFGLTVFTGASLACGLAPIRKPPLGASPHARLAPVKIARPKTKTRRRPRKSASLPPVSMNAAKVRA